ncbi:MAG: phosphomannomutase/phosphoglucomutase [Thermodesulfobacteriota bacterium]
MANISDNIFREYDIRGTYGVDLTTETAELIARAYGVYVRGSGLLKDPITVSIGMDVRTSSEPLKGALIKGLTESGINCVDLGVCPTPLQYFSTHTLQVNGGFMITGSHNPPEYNGFKISIGKETIHGTEIQLLKEVIKKDVLGHAPPEFTPGTVDKIDIISRYIEDIKGRFDLAPLKRPIKVVLDGGNGTAGPVAPQLLRDLGCEVVELYCTPDGTFPNHHPDPTVPANLVDIIERVKSEGADFGVAYDGDADRIGVVDEGGDIIWGDRLMVIFARDILEEKPGETIVGEVKCSQVLYDEIKKRGGTPVMWKTGHSLIKSRMKELGAAMAGEMSGHIFFADRYYGFDDAIYASCRLAEILAKRRVKDEKTAFSTLLANLPATQVTPEVRVECPDELKFKVIDKLKEIVGEGTEDFRVRDIITIDGLRINFEGGWALVRASNTQPVLVLRIEASTEELLDRAKSFMKETLRSAAPEVSVPF